MGFQFVDGGKRFINLLLNDALLPFKGQRDALKLRMADDDGIIVTGGDAGAEFFTVGSLKVLAPCYQKFCVRVEVQKLRSPLLRQMQPFRRSCLPLLRVQAAYYRHIAHERWRCAGALGG